MNLNIGQRRVGDGEPSYVVAEIGINHNGDMNLACQMIQAAKDAGADAVKFQNYRTEDFLSDRSLIHRYVSQGREVEELQYDMFKRCELDREQLAGLVTCCSDLGIDFHSTPTSEGGVSDLVSLGVPVLKNGSDYLTHLPLIRSMGRTGLPTVLSTGMATFEEIDDAARAFRSTGNEGLLLLACTSRYPTPALDVHLRRIPAIAAAFKCLAGFSDHTDGIAAALGAVALGACWIEKHFTLDRTLHGPDHGFSSEPAEFASLVRAIRYVEDALGESRIGPTASEAESRADFRLSCVAARALPQGHQVELHEIAFHRPGNGIRPADAQTLIIGRRLTQSVRPGQVFGPEHFA
jgi:N,N'-diacetyllegionaminate synthase